MLNRASRFCGDEGGATATEYAMYCVCRPRHDCRRAGAWKRFEGCGSQEVDMVVTGGGGDRPGAKTAEMRV
jgi:hypothetical protein